MLLLRDQSTNRSIDRSVGFLWGVKQRKGEREAKWRAEVWVELGGWIFGGKRVGVSLSVLKVCLFLLRISIYNLSMGLLGRVLQVCRARVRVVNGQVRSLHLHEYQSQEIMRGFGIRVPRGSAVSTKEEALAAAKSLGEGTDIVVKAQILAGGRGMGTFGNGFKSGVHICYEPEKAAEVASKMVGQKLITKQTGPEGKLCSKVDGLHHFTTKSPPGFSSTLIPRFWSSPFVPLQTALRSGPRYRENVRPA